MDTLEKQLQTSEQLRLSAQEAVIAQGTKLQVLPELSLGFRALRHWQGAR